ncbi:MAG: hypothetical protein VX746_00100 [Candidatus Neomarinimicrobiota bacterium]|nr:hypothetical protein [Candidatus Neomarinimicrobiota bacterium]MEC9474306.1 hypothetical protein [Candidatus Neomarinimicrobiota bacterium]MEE3302984.1 hypothetical protein [Candidatus Neomarinimicrobiota bacterium]|tara:strand:- start:2893 stop:3444 length:552 start_codon:yes stop_codon:yes gene_type:complete
MINKKNTKAVAMILLMVFNVAMIAFTLYNLVSINSGKQSTLLYQSADERNKNYYSQLSKILNSLNNNELQNLETLTDYYVYDSSIEAISNRELFKKKGVTLPQYTISKELTNFTEASVGKIGFLQLGYALNNKTFSDMMIVLQTINNNQRFDYINQLNVSKVKGSNGRLNMSFTYTNLGLVLE